MKKITAIFLALAVLTASLLTGCGKKYDSEITVYNWGEYIDESVLTDFESQYNIKVNYKTFDTNESLYSTLKTGGYNIDVVIVSDYMLSRLAEESMLETLNYSNIPNYSLIGDDFKNLSYDPANQYTVPYMWGTVGLIYNSALISEDITSWGALFDEKYAGQVVMIDNSRDAMAIALLYLGYDVNTTDEAQLNEAYDLLVQQKDVVQAYAMDQIFDKLEGSEAAIGVYYAGDYLTMLENNPDLKFVLPDEGTTWFIDAMCIPKGTANKDSAEKFINFMASTDVMVKNMAEIGYTSPNTEAFDVYSAELDELSLKVMNPGSDVLSKCTLFTNLPQSTLDLYDELWVKLKS